MKNSKQRITLIMGLIRESVAENLDDAEHPDGWGFWRIQCARYGDMIEMQVDELLTAALVHPLAADMTVAQVNADVVTATQLLWVNLLARQAARSEAVQIEVQEMGS